MTTQNYENNVNTEKDSFTVFILFSGFWVWSYHGIICVIVLFFTGMRTYFSKFYIFWIIFCTLLYFKLLVFIEKNPLLSTNILLFIWRIFRMDANFTKGNSFKNLGDLGIKNTHKNYVRNNFQKLRQSNLSNWIV